MPTKPTPVVRPRWNTGGANRVTPSSGKIALGWEANEAPSSSFFNWWKFEVGEIAAWVLDGSSAGAANAHIVETDSTGAAGIARLSVLGQAASTVGMDATGCTGAGPAVGARGTGVGARPGVEGLGGNGAPTGSGDTLTGGSGVRGLSGTSDLTAGVLGIGLAAANCYGVEGHGSGGAPGVYGTCTAASGVYGQGGSGASSHGVEGHAANTGADGVHGVSAVAATTSAAGVHGIGIGDARGVHGEAADGYGVVAESDSSSPTRAALRVVPQNADPTTAIDGDIAYIDDGTVDDLKVRARAGWRSLLWRTLGQTYGHAFDAGPTTSNDNVLWQDVLTVSLAAPNDPRRVGDVRILVTGEVGVDTLVSGGDDIEIRVFDDTDNVTVDSRVVEIFETSESYQRDIAWGLIYTLPDTGSRSFILQVRRSGSDDIVAIRNAMMVIEGVF